MKMKFSITHLNLDILECSIFISHDLGEQLQHISNREQQRLLLQREIAIFCDSVKHFTRLSASKYVILVCQNPMKIFVLKTLAVLTHNDTYAYLIIGRREFFHCLAQNTHSNVLQVT